MRSVVVGGGAVLCLLLAACGSDNNRESRPPPDEPAPPVVPLPAGTLQFDVSALQVAESQPSINVSITRTAGSRGAVSVALSTADGTAVAGQDYTAVNTTVTFADGDTATKTIAIPVIDDGDHEPDETFTVTLSSPTGDATLGTQTSMSIAIEANDVPPPPVPATLGVNLALKQVQFSWPAVSSATHYQLLKKPNSVSGFTQVGSNLAASATSTTLDIGVHLQDWANVRYKLAACNAGGCSDSNEVDTIGAAVQAIGYFKASNPGASDQLGFSMALSADGNTLAVSARGESSAATGIDGNQADNTASSSGAVYMFTRAGSGWSQQAYVKASNTGAGDGFGRSVALSANGNTLVVGAPSETSNATGIDGDQTDNSMSNAGAVYVFTRAGTTWSQQAYVKASNTGPGAYFGWQVALSADGDTLAVSSDGEKSNATGIDGDQTDISLYESGAVYMFTRAGSAWSQRAYLKASNTGDRDVFGFAIALSADGGTLAVGAYTEDSAATGIDGDQTDNTGTNSGAVYIFTGAGGTWAQQAYVKAFNAGMEDRFGHSVALSANGDTLAVGAHRERSAATGIDGDGADNTALNSGAAYVFTRAGSTWLQRAYVKASNTAAQDQFGFSVALSADGSTLAVGANMEDSAATDIDGDQTSNSASASGAVYVFRRASNAWSQQSYVKASNTGANDQFGASVVLGADGESLLVGAQSEASNATGVGGDQSNNGANGSGAVYLY